MISAGKSGQNELRETVADVGRVTPVEDLKDKGISKIRVVSESQLQDTLRVAVNRVLRTQLDDVPLPSEAREAIADRAAAEFQRLRNEGLETAPVTEAPVHVIPPVAEAPAAPTVTPEPAPAPPVAVDLTPPPSSQDTDPVDHEAATDLLRAEKALAELTGVTAPDSGSLSPESAENLRDMEQRMAQNISELLAQNLKREMSKVENSHREQVSLLELRIAKLASALESTDRALQSLQTVRSGGAVEDANEQAALDPSSPLFAKKSQLLDALFQANLVLRELQSNESEG